MIEWWKQKISRNECILLALGILYFCILYKYYSITYYVPDFGAYFNMSVNGAKAKDGFSSLFLWFAAFAASMPIQLSLFSLILMSIAMVNISFFIKSLFIKSDFYYYMSILVLYSCCAFYYFYGKLFYDFPFTAFIYSVSLLVLSKFYKNINDGNSVKNIWYILCLLLGFLLSWKPYNVFLVAGLGLLMFGKKESRIFLLSVLKFPSKMLASIIIFISGYFIGNYNLLIDFKATVIGIKAYPANYNLKDFLLGKSRIIWDHINDLPFNLSVMNLVTMFVLIFFLPILYKRIWYLSVSVFMMLCLGLYINHFSPGYAWHGFPFGLFIVVFTAFFLSDIKSTECVDYKKILLLDIVIIQIVICFIYYIPLQNRWYKNTQQAIEILEIKESDIYEDVNELLDEVGDSNFMIDLAVKRYKPVANSVTSWKPLNLQNTYFAASNYEFLNPLEATNVVDWKNLYKKENYRYNREDCQYVIWIIPDIFKQMSDVANIHIYDGYEIQNMIHGNGYSVYLYKMQ